MGNVVTTSEVCVEVRRAKVEVPWTALIFGGCVWVVVYELVRAAVNFEHWAWVVR